MRVIDSPMLLALVLATAATAGVWASGSNSEASDIPEDVTAASPATDSVAAENAAKLSALNTKLAIPWTEYTGNLGKGTFLEQFKTDVLGQSGWHPSEAKKADDTGSYQGTWKLQQAESGTQKGDYALILQDKAKHHAISHLFKKPFEFAGSKMFVVQYEVKLQEPLDCGGAYLKLLSAPTDGKQFDPKKFHDDQPFTIMFGPDKCGSETNKVHFIFHHKNKETGKLVQHALKKAPTPPTWENKATHLYRLIVYPEENRYEVSVDDGERVSGSLLADDFTPPVDPPAEIDDPNDKKPDTWEDEDKIPDPNPENYNESVPKEIPDETDVMPDDWLEEEQLKIDDLTAEKPAGWDSEIDGEWVRLKIDNPKCAHGRCGKWKPRMKRNPEYKERKMVPNPKYKGVWAPRKIKNEKYYSNTNVGKMMPIVGVGFELWTMQHKILFDNLLVSNTITKEQLDAFTAATWKAKSADEKELAELLAPKKETPDVKPLYTWREQLSIQNVGAFFSLLLTSPRSTWDVYPALLGITAASAGLIFLFLLSLLCSSKKKVVSKAGSEKAKKSRKSTSATDDSDTGSGADEKLLKDKDSTSGNLTRRNPKSKQQTSESAE